MTVNQWVDATGVPTVGTMHLWYSATPPTGWLDATSGAAVSRTTYSNLFAKIGTTWGVGDGSTTFNLPNLDPWIDPTVTGASTVIWIIKY